MKAVIQPLAWGLAMATILALASGVALDMAINTTQAAVIHHDHGQSAAPAAASGQLSTDAAATA